MSFSRRAGITTMVTLALLACAKHVQRQLTPPTQAATLDKRSPFLKVHAHDGRLYVLDSWQVDTAARTVSGAGRLFDVERVARDSGPFTLSLDSIDLLETNVVQTSPSVAVVAALSVVTGVVAVACLTNPKACFGSCPTFYAETPGGEQLLAEGFSASVAPALEATDVDALFPARPPVGERTLTLRMRNEAWETHVVRYVRVLAAPRAPDGRVFATADGQFIQADRVASPVACRAAEGDCRELLEAHDARERSSRADSTDLAAREEIELEFEDPAARDIGLVVAYRQTLLTTYLFYQALAWLGDGAGEWLAAMARSPFLRNSGNPLYAALGKIEIQVPDGAGWVVVGSVGETGPLATDVKVVPLPRHTGGPVRLRLRLTQGLWRLDQVALARLGPRVVPVRLQAARASAPARPPAELAAWIADSTRPLVTLPGDDVALEFDLPDEPARLELFLEARGYYLEWMRQSWLAETQPARAAHLYMNPAGALREIAPEFSRLEPEIERIFWSSRHARN